MPVRAPNPPQAAAKRPTPLLSGAATVAAASSPHAPDPMSSMHSVRPNAAARCAATYEYRCGRSVAVICHCAPHPQQRTKEMMCPAPDLIGRRAHHRHCTRGAQLRDHCETSNVAIFGCGHRRRFGSRPGSCKRRCCSEACELPHDAIAGARACVCVWGGMVRCCRLVRKPRPQMIARDTLPSGAKEDEHHADAVIVAVLRSKMSRRGAVGRFFCHCCFCTEHSECSEAFHMPVLPARPEVRACSQPGSLRHQGGRHTQHPRIQS